MAQDIVGSVNRLATQDAATSVVINLATNYFAYRGAGLVPLTVDSISSGDPTLFSRSIPGALFLCAVLGTIGWFKFRRRGRSLPGADVALLERPYFFAGLRIVAFYTLFVFGLLVTLGVLLQAFAGSLSVPASAAIAIATAIAGASAWFITAATMRAQLRAG
ncbi:MAG: hypothetical protein MUF07_13010 [Steroidobacteraceae bacterium]|jgi:hypothetical protein|nr:hypothetical protein [Steroidobacteraceae bacterium]